MPDLVPVRRALLSVSDKTGLIDLAAALSARGVELISTGGSARTIRAAGVKVRDVCEITGFPEIMNGRLKTLHPLVHGGLLALRDDDDHVAAMDAYGIGAIDLLIVNLYPFEAAVAVGAQRDACIDQIDIGGPAMIRAAAKNHEFVGVVVDVRDYAPLLDELRANDGASSLGFRRRLAQTAYARTAAYDAAVSSWMAAMLEEAPPPRRWTVGAGMPSRTLRYGENPHQRAAFHADGSGRPGAGSARQHQGRALSYNNLNDTDTAFELVAEFDPADGPVCAIVKHATPCGVARGATLAEAYEKAFDCDRSSAFGGIVALNQTLDGITAGKIVEHFTEVVIAPKADEDAKSVFARQRNLRLLTTGGLPDPRADMLTIRQIAGGLLVQDRDNGCVDVADLEVVTKRPPTDAELADALFAWKVAKHVKSNAVVCAKDGITIGIGAGQTSRIASTRIAVRKARDMSETLGPTTSSTRGSVVASDGFFPFPDNVRTIAEAGVTCVIQPGGSIRDDDVIAAADAAELAMVFTTMRHFLH
ncbi:MAG: bifunctional phosphoribosylaminoimidazolecarboxamide formyltransferase/IMP cyclohydrolase [Pseudomonadota bacterium]